MMINHHTFVLSYIFEEETSEPESRITVIECARFALRRNRTL